MVLTLTCPETAVPWEHPGSMLWILQRTGVTVGRTSRVQGRTENKQKTSVQNLNTSLWALNPHP